MANYSVNSSESLLQNFLEDTQSGMGKFASAVSPKTNVSLDDIMTRLDKAISKTAGAMEEEAALMEQEQQPMVDDAQVAASEMIAESAEKVNTAANAISQAANTAAQVSQEAVGVAQEVAQTVEAVKTQPAPAPEGEMPAEPTPEELDQAIETVASAIVEAFEKAGSMEELLAPTVAEGAAQGAAQGVMEAIGDEELEGNEEALMSTLGNNQMSNEELMPILASCAEQYILDKYASGELELDEKTAGLLDAGLGALKGMGGAALGAMKAHPGMTGAIGGGLAGLGAGMGLGSMMGGQEEEFSALAELLEEAGMIPPGQDPIQWVQQNPDEAVNMGMQILQQQGFGGQQEGPSELDALASAYFGEMNKTASSRNQGFSKEAAAKAQSDLQNLTMLAALGAATLEKAAGVNTGLTKEQENNLLKAAAAAYQNTFSK